MKRTDYVGVAMATSCQSMLSHVGLTPVSSSSPSAFTEAMTEVLHPMPSRPTPSVSPSPCPTPSSGHESISNEPEAIVLTADELSKMKSSDLKKWLEDNKVPGRSTASSKSKRVALIRGYMANKQRHEEHKAETKEIVRDVARWNKHCGARLVHLILATNLNLTPDIKADMKQYTNSDFPTFCEGRLMQMFCNSEDRLNRVDFHGKKPEDSYWEAMAQLYNDPRLKPTLFDKNDVHLKDEHGDPILMPWLLNGKQSAQKLKEKRNKYRTNRTRAKNNFSRSGINEDDYFKFCTTDFRPPRDDNSNVDYVQWYIDLGMKHTDDAIANQLFDSGMPESLRIPGNLAHASVEILPSFSASSSSKSKKMKEMTMEDFKSIISDASVSSIGQEKHMGDIRRYEEAIVKAQAAEAKESRLFNLYERFSKIDPANKRMREYLQRQIDKAEEALLNEEAQDDEKKVQGDENSKCSDSNGSESEQDPNRLSPHTNYRRAKRARLN